MKEHQKESALYLCDPSKNADADGSPVIVYKNRMEALSSILPKENGTASHGV